MPTIAIGSELERWTGPEMISAGEAAHVSAMAWRISASGVGYSQAEIAGRDLPT